MVSGNALDCQSMDSRFDPCRLPRYNPSEEFELTANSLGAHIETHGKLILRTLRYLTMSSQDDSHCEIPASIQ